MTIGINLPTIQADSYKKLKCGQCMHQERAPRPPNKPIDLKEPPVLICRKNPPQIVYAIGQGPQGQPIPMQLGSMYPMVGLDYPACSRFIQNKDSDTTT